MDQTDIFADRLDLPFRSATFDAVVCTMAFHFFDQPQAWCDFHRVLTPGGHAVVGTVHPRTAIGSDRLSRVASAGSKTRMTFPTAPDRIHWHEEEATDRARRRLARARHRFRALGALVAGEIGPEDPLLALAAALRGHPSDVTVLAA
jgi:SAM-dependent methyltransferase